MLLIIILVIIMMCITITRISKVILFALVEKYSTLFTVLFVQFIVEFISLYSVVSTSSKVPIIPKVFYLHFILYQYMTHNDLWFSRTTEITDIQGAKQSGGLRIWGLMIQVIWYEKVYMNVLLFRIQYIFEYIVLDSIHVTKAHIRFQKLFFFMLKALVSS